MLDLISLPKSTAISSYSYRTTRSMNLCFLEKLMHRIHADVLLDAKVFDCDSFLYCS